MKRKRPSKFEIAVRVAVVMVIVIIAVLGAFLPSVPDVRAQTNTTYPVSVVSSTHVDNPEGGMSYDVNCPDSAIINNYADAEVIYDFGQIYNVYRVAWGGGTYQTNHELDLYVSIDGETWGDPVWGLSYGPGCNEHFETPNLYTSARYVRIVGKDDTSAHLDVLDFILVDEGTTTPGTPTPTPAYATPLPAQPTACVTAMPTGTATHQPSPTPLIGSTPTPTRTPTPGGPTATPTPAPTGTPGPSFDSGTMTFNLSLSPWTTGDTSPLSTTISTTTWLNWNGPDGQPGIALIGDSMSKLYDEDDGAKTLREQIYDALVYVRSPGLTVPFRVTGSAKFSHPIPPGAHVYLNLWYYDQSLSGSFKWVRDKVSGVTEYAEQSNTWRAFDFVVSAPITHTIAVIALAPSFDFAGDTPGALEVDNLRIYSGPQAVAGSFPVCQGSGAGSHPVTTKVCIIKQISVDVMSRGCTAPTSLIDLWNWIVYAVCRVENYFTWFAENTQQINTLKDRQNADEPFGTFFEASDMIGVIANVIRDIGATYGNNASEYRQINWQAMFDFRQLDAIANVLHIPNDPGVLARYRSRCPALPSEEMNSQLFAKYGCLVLTFTRDQMPVFGVWQWVIDVSSIIGLIIYAQRILSKK